MTSRNLQYFTPHTQRERDIHMIPGGMLFIILGDKCNTMMGVKEWNPISFFWKWRFLQKGNNGVIEKLLCGFDYSLLVRLWFGRKVFRIFSSFCFPHRSILGHQFFLTSHSHTPFSLTNPVENKVDNLRVIYELTSTFFFLLQASFWQVPIDLKQYVIVNRPSTMPSSARKEKNSV